MHQPRAATAPLADCSAYERTNPYITSQKAHRVPRIAGAILGEKTKMVYNEPAAAQATRKELPYFDDGKPPTSHRAEGAKDTHDNRATKHAEMNQSIESPREAWDTRREGLTAANNNLSPGSGKKGLTHHQINTQYTTHINRPKTTHVHRRTYVAQKSTAATQR